MDVLIGDLLTVEGQDYITLQKLVNDNNEYIFVNKIINEEATDEFYIYKIVDGGLKIVVDNKIRNILLPKFQELLEKDIKELL